MTKFMKACLITGGICILVGGGISLVAASLGGNLWEVMPRKAAAWKTEISEAASDGLWQDFDNVWSGEELDYWDNQGMEEGQEIFSSDFAAEEIKKLDLEARTGKIAFVEDASADKIKIYCNKDDSYWKWHVENDELNIQVYPGKAGNEDDTDVILTIHVPEDYHFSSVDLKSAHSDHFSKQDSQSPVIMAQSLTSDEASLVTKAGAIVIRQGNVGNLEVSSDVGAVEYSGSVSGDIDGDCKVGAIHLQLTGKKEDYNYEIQCRLGAVKIGDGNSVALKSNEQLDNGADKEMDLECKTGAIQVDFMNEL